MAGIRRMASSADHLLGLVEDGLMAGLLAAAACLGLLQIILRYFFATGFDWVESFLIMFVVYAALIGASVAVRRGLHVRLDVLVDKLSPRPRWAVTLGTEMLCLAYTLALWWFALQFVIQVRKFGIINIESDLPQWVHSLAGPVGMGLMSLRYLQAIWRLVAAGPGFFAQPDGQR
jgi:C4-dicarboxylate transporter, DctQ subunit